MKKNNSWEVNIWKKDISKVRSDILQWDVNITATKVFDMFIDTNKNFTIAKKKTWNNSY